MFTQLQGYDCVWAIKIFIFQNELVKEPPGKYFRQNLAIRKIARVIPKFVFFLFKINSVEEPPIHRNLHGSVGDNF